MGRVGLRALTGFKSVYEAPRFDYGNLVNRGAPPGALGQGFKNLKGLGVGGHSVRVEALIDLGDDVGRVPKLVKNQITTGARQTTARGALGWDLARF